MTTRAREATSAGRATSAGGTTSAGGATSADRLITATRELMWERGYVGTSPKAIQARSGVGQGSMYHHFASKADLARAAELQTIAEARERREAGLHGAGRAVERLASYLRRTSDGPLAGCPIGRMVADADVVADPALRTPIGDWVREAIADLAGVIREAQADGDLGADLDADLTATSLLAARQGAYVLARATADPQMFDRAVDGLLAGLGVGPDGRGVGG